MSDRENPTVDHLTVDHLSAAGGGLAVPAATLVIYHRDGAQAMPLVDGGSVTLGRGVAANVPLRDPSLSRLHARFSCTDGVVKVEDLESRNGTRVNGKKIDVRKLKHDDVVKLGAVSVVVFSGESLAKPLGLEGHERFVHRLEEEILRARTFERPLSLVLVRAATRKGAHLSRWAPRVRELLRPVDHMALYGPNAVEILLPEAGEEEATALAAEVVEGRAPTEPTLLCGVALYPQSAASAAELVGEAGAASQRATATHPIQVGGSSAGDRVAESIEVDDSSGILTDSPVMRRVLDTVRRVARAEIPVLIFGETGSGKELVARAIHAQGPRGAGPMRSINCGALPQNLVESALFGHEKGAFTGADRQTRGVFEESNRGTVFLDEIGELPPSAQAALLRVLETKKVQRVGSSKEIEVDARVVAATHRDLEAMVADGTFREDLLFRLNTVTIAIPPLRERPGDVQLLAEHFLGQAARANNRRMKGINDDALAMLVACPWPGNVRQLRNAIERAVVLAQGDRITVDDLPERVRRGSAGAASSTSTSGSVRIDPGEDVAFKDRMKQIEIDLILDALKRSNWNQTQAAKLLKMPLRTLAYKIKSYGLKEPQRD